LKAAFIKPNKLINNSFIFKYGLYLTSYTFLKKANLPDGFVRVKNSFGSSCDRIIKIGSGVNFLKHHFGKPLFQMTARVL
jgi:hypothetical protein